MVEDRNGTILQKEDKMTGVKKAEILKEEEKEKGESDFLLI